MGLFRSLLFLIELLADTDLLPVGVVASNVDFFSKVFGDVVVCLEERLLKSSGSGSLLFFIFCGWRIVPVP